MSVKYKLLKNSKELSKLSEYRVVTIENQVVDIEQIGEDIQNATTLTPSDINAAIIAIRREMAIQLKMGNAVHLPGIGYFTLSVKGELYQDPRSKHFRLRKPMVRTVKFRPDMKMINTLSDTKFENATYQESISSIPKREDIDNAIVTLLSNQPFFSIRELRQYLNLSQVNAYRIAKKLEKEGKIRNIGKGRSKLFILNDSSSE